MEWFAIWFFGIILIYMVFNNSDIDKLKKRVDIIERYLDESR